VRYAGALNAFKGSNTTSLQIINAGLTAGTDPSIIRTNLINQILPLVGTDGSAPVSHFYMNLTFSGEYMGYGAGTTYNGTSIGGGSDYYAKVTGGDHVVTTANDFIAHMDNGALEAASGSTVFIPTGTTLDFTLLDPVVIPAGVTIASDRGTSGHEGAILTKTRPHTNGTWQEPMLQIGGTNVRITGLQLRGEGYAQDTWGTYPTTCAPSAGSCANEASFMIGIKNGESTTGAGYTGLEIDNNEMQGWAYAAVFTNGVSTVGRPFIHHNDIHDNNNRGEGYGVNSRGGDMLVAGNTFDYNRHSVTGDGVAGEKYTFQYNIIGGRGTGIGTVDIDVHESTSTSNLAGNEYHIDHNTVTTAGTHGFAQIREVPTTGFYLSYNNIASDGGSTNGFSYPVVQFTTSTSSLTKVYATNNIWKGTIYVGNTGMTQYINGEG
jgi:hypothetical protein